MRKVLQTSFLLFLVLCSILFHSCCKKQERGQYDLFPLKVGNEFYYRYDKYRYTGISAYTKGNETWKVLSESSQENSITYIIERKLNATLIVAGDTIIITDSKSYLEIIEDKSSSVISVFGFNFKRYQEVTQLELAQQGYTSSPSLTCLFKADSGMTKYIYHHPPNQITDESLYLDSLKLVDK
jgi:hypothetical protein